MAEDRNRESLKDETNTAVEEARMVLPGIQALFGFQLIAELNARFEQLPMIARQAHLAAIGCVTLAIAFVMAPAAYHRIAERGWVSRRLIDLTSNLITAGMAMLMLGLSIDLGLAGFLAVGSTAVAATCSLVSLCIFALCWFAYPLSSRRR